MFWVAPGLLVIIDEDGGGADIIGAKSFEAAMRIAEKIPSFDKIR